MVTGYEAVMNARKRLKYLFEKEPSIMKFKITIHMRSGREHNFYFKSEYETVDELRDSFIKKMKEHDTLIVSGRVLIVKGIEMFYLVCDD